MITQASKLYPQLILAPQWRPWWRALGIIGLVMALWVGYVSTGRPVNLVINNQTQQVRAHNLSVRGVLQEMGLVLTDTDLVEPAPDATLAPGDTITIRLARPVTVEADGHTSHVFTHQTTVAAVLAQAGVAINPRDEISIDGAAASPAATLPAPTTAHASGGLGIAGLLMANNTSRVLAMVRPAAVQLIIHRAMPITLHDGQLQTTFYTTQPNIGEALLAQGVTLFLGDKVTPGPGTPLSPGLQVYIQRSIPVNITIDGHTLKTRTRSKTVGEVLAQEGLVLMGQDFSRPAADHVLAANDLIEVVRVREVLQIEQEIIPFEAKWEPDPQLELDTQEMRQQGVNGAIKKRSRVRYENGQEVARVIEDEWLDREPLDRVIVYGTHIVARTLNTDNGPIEYWRKIPMLATAYSAATSGKSRDHPEYGITRSGLPAGYGIVAVDPKVIPLMTKLYIPGYGEALAGDTGGGVLGKHVDLGYNEDQTIPNLYEWRDVYVLTPIPPPDKIRYVLPQWPQQR